MALDEAMRHRIHGRFEELLGHDEAAALMSVLPVEDRVLDRIDRLEERLRARIDALDAKIDGVEDRLTLKIDVAVERARAETSREARHALLAAFGVVAAVAAAVLSAIGFFA